MSRTKTVSAKTEAHIRWMIRRDMAEVLQIAQSIPEDIWDEEMFARAMRRRNCIAMVATVVDVVVGYVVYELGKSAIYISAVVVAPGFRRRGVGAAILRKMTTKVHALRRRTLFVDVSEANLDAQLFLKNTGFECRHILRGGDNGGGHDMYRFVWSKGGGDDLLAAS